jgi:hypothetical protein
MVYFNKNKFGYKISDYEKCGHVACVREIRNANKYFTNTLAFLGM